MALARHSVGRNRARAATKPELVHEMSEGTTLTPGKPARQRTRRVLRGTVQKRAILDEESLLATCAYIDLNPVAAGIVEVPEASPHTSNTARVELVKEQGRIPDLTAARSGDVAGSNAAAGLEESIWLCPVEGCMRRGLRVADQTKQLQP
jgi:hypothetical protein